MQIRTFEEKDTAQLLDLIKLHVPASFAETEIQDFEDYLKFEREHYFVIQVHEMVVACGGINFKETADQAWLSWDMVHPDFQSKGFGSMLLNHRIEVIKRMPQIHTLWVRTSQTASKFYENKGFKTLRHVADFWAEGFDLVEMKMEMI
jgi:N-acetylglutamate synthase-like GNAT family acetyltransferase